MTHYINPKLSERERDIIKGTVLGGSSIIKPSGGKNCYLSMRSKDGQWLDFKAHELNGLSSQEPVTIEKTNRWHSLCYPIFNDIRSLFWDKKERKISDKAFEGISFVSYMIWFGDAGIYKNGIVVLNTHVWGEEGTNKIVKHLNSVNYNASVFLERKNFRVKLSNESSFNFMRSISVFFPHFLAAKISKSIGKNDTPINSV